MDSRQLPPTPYVSSQLLPRHVGHTVRIIGRLVQSTPDSLRAQVESVDTGVINVHRNAGSTPYQSKFVCITGVVQPDQSVRESTFEDFGESFDLANFNTLIGMMAKAPEVFVS